MCAGRAFSVHFASPATDLGPSSKSACNLLLIADVLVVMATFGRPRRSRWDECGQRRSELPSLPGRRGTCGGHRVAPDKPCLAHATDSDKRDYFSSLSNGSDVDLRGTEVSESLFTQLLDAVKNPTSGIPEFGAVKFSWAKFLGEAHFGAVIFEKEVNFNSVIFGGVTTFEGSIFRESATFRGVVFESQSRFRGAVFESAVDFALGCFKGKASFPHARFEGPVGFQEVSFESQSVFESTQFLDRAYYLAAKFAGRARFRNATFSRSVDFSDANLSSSADFGNATFNGNANFERAQVQKCLFPSVRFGRDVLFSAAVIGWSSFASCSFSGLANFTATVFSDDATFRGAAFEGLAYFAGAIFMGNARFTEVNFGKQRNFGPISCSKSVILSRAVFPDPVIVEIAAAEVLCLHTVWEAAALLRIRYASVVLSNSVFGSSVVVSSADPFVVADEEVANLPSLSPLSPAAKIASLRGVDTGRLLLVDADLTMCHFGGAIHLDQLRLEGDCRFASTPSGFHRQGWRFVRWTPRHSIAEERAWRGSRGNPAGWVLPDHGVDSAVTPAALAVIYRHLRKSLEDSKNEPDAADFYYGEMEMRRKDARRARSERLLLGAYWLISGYGLRAARALFWLSASMATTLLILGLWGLPDHAPVAVSRGIISGHQFESTTKMPAPTNPSGSLSDRLSTARLERGLRVVVNSVVFRSSGQSLTTTGTYVEMVSRITEPILLGLAVLAVRGRLKR